jgi:hypothetical protein
MLLHFLRKICCVKDVAFICMTLRTGTLLSAAAAALAVAMMLVGGVRTQNDGPPEQRHTNEAEPKEGAAVAAVSSAALAAAVSSAASSAAVSSAACSNVAEHSEHCGAWAEAGECTANPSFMHANCAQSCGCPEAPAADCADRDTSGACASWAASGECESNPAYMKLRCAKSCNSCDMLDYKKRCPMLENRTAAVGPGQMSEAFQRAVREFPELEPSILSNGLDGSQPWVVSFDRFLSPDEVDRLLEHGDERYVRSTASGGRKGDEFIPLTSEIRTSYTTWCDNATCYEDPVIRRIYDRVEEVTRVPSQNYEYLQLLRYMPCEHPGAKDCQFYRRHHDTIPELAEMQPGPRVYTFFLYLSDVEEGGGTKFDGGFTVQPKKGKAVWWPATLEAEPFKSDGRTHHEALPVTRGVKYAANFWLHQYDYVSAHEAGCTT